MEFVIIIWLLCTLGCAIIGDYKSCGSIGGMFIGLFLGLLGLIIILCLSDVKKSAPKQSNLPSSNIADELTKYANLYKEGHLTLQEFNAQKARLLIK